MWYNLIVIGFRLWQKWGDSIFKEFGVRPTFSGTINRIVRFDFMNLVEKKNSHYKLRTNSKMLISVSHLLKCVNEVDLYPIPDKVLMEARDRGKSVMEMLERVFNDRISDLNEIWGSVEIKLTVQTIINWLLEHKCKILAIEKFITNGTYCGFIDMIVREPNGVQVIYEIKCRNDNSIRIKDYIQMELYSRMLQNAPCRLFVIDKNNKITTYPYQIKRNNGINKTNKNFFQHWSYLTRLLKILNEISPGNFPKVEKIKIGVQNKNG